MKDDAMTSDEWRAGVTRQLANIEHRLAKLEQSDAVDDVMRQGIETRLKSIEDTLKWLVRLVLGALILALLGAAMRGVMPLA